MGSCQPCHERAFTPMPSSMIASSPAVTCSPEATTASYSRASCSGAASRAQATSSLVLPAMAETTTATSWPASTSRFTWRATLRMRSISATDVPPNFITRRAMPRRIPESRADRASGRRACEKARIHSGEVWAPQPWPDLDGLTNEIPKSRPQRREGLAARRRHHDVRWPDRRGDRGAHRRQGEGSGRQLHRLG